MVRLINQLTNLQFLMQNLKPKKHLGQHFLTDMEIADNIVGLLRAEPQSQVVEIGPGPGVLSVRLIERFKKLMLIEVDPDAISYLNKHYPALSPSIVHQDVLKWKPEQHIAPDSYFIGNLPYNISSPFFFLLLDQLPYIQEGVFMIQKEVAARICANEGSKIYGILSILLGVYFEREYAFSVAPEAFSPPPKVVSGVIRLTRRPHPPEVEFSALKQVVKTAFNQRRKVLRNALKGLNFRPFPELAGYMSLRAEALSIDAFCLLATHLQR